MWWGRLHDFNVKTATEGHYFPRFFRGGISQLCSDHANLVTSGDGWLARFTCAYDSGTRLLGVLILHRNWQEWGAMAVRSRVQFFETVVHSDNEVSFENWNFSEIVYFNFLILTKKKKKKKTWKLSCRLSSGKRHGLMKYMNYVKLTTRIYVYIYISRIRLIYTLKKYINYLF